ncbi:MAG: MFS transporter [Clostridia bacterium]|nr:MFS transporter [Clostridia bacterium]
MENRWKRTLYLVWFIQILSLMSFSFGLPFLPYYIQDMGVTDPDKLRLFTGILSSAPAIGMGIMAPIWGMIADRYGKKPMLLRAMLSASIILTGLGLVNSVTGVLVLRAMQGFLTGTITAAAALVAGETPKDKMAFALGFMVSSSFIGRTVGPAVGGILAETLGYKPSFYLGGATMLICFFLVLFFVKETKKPYVKHELKGMKNVLSVLTLPVILMLATIFTLRIGQSVARPYLPLYIQQIRGTIEGSAMTTGLISAGASVMAALAALTLPKLGDRYGRKKLANLYLSAAIAISIPLIISKGLIAFGVFYALLFFVLTAVEPMLMSDTLDMVPDKKHGLLFGIRATVGSIAWAISPMIGSAVSIGFSLNAVFYLIPIFLALTLGMIFLTGHKKTGQQSLG